MKRIRRPAKSGLRLALLVFSIGLLASALQHSKDPSANVGANQLTSLAQAPERLAHLPILARSAQRNWSTPLAPPSAAPTTATPASTSAATPRASATRARTPFPSQHQPFGLVRLEPQLRLEGSGSIIDSLAFWEADDAADSLLLVTAKGNQRVEVWQQPFEGGELPALEHPSFGSSQVNGIVVDQDLDLAYISVSQPASTVAVFSLPGLSYLRQLVGGEVNLRSEPNLALLELPDASKQLYVSADNRVYVYDSATGAALADFEPAVRHETLLADDFHQALYIPDENFGSGVHAYHPDGSPYEREGRTRFGGGGIFEADAEGITQFTCPADGQGDDGRGWLIVSDQKGDASDFEFFDRLSWTHLGRLQLEGVTNTDGIASTQQALPAHPSGLFAAVDNDTSVALISWDRILEVTGLSCEGEALPAH